jgi:lipoprotein-anchoring transpeptidase ErfK/SrfK
LKTKKPRTPKARGCLALGLALGLTLVLTVSLQAQNAGTTLSTARTPRVIVVSIPDRKLAVLENGKIVRIFSVAVGASISPSPTGDFHIVNRISNPTYYHSGVVIPPGSDNPIGPRWLGLDRKGYGIHGTNEPRSIGKAASHGCIRLSNRDIEQLFTLVRAGDVVHIVDARDTQFTSVFGGPASAGTVAEVRSVGGPEPAGGQ